MSKQKQLKVRVGDVVQIGPSRYAPHLGEFQAEVLKLSENSIGQTIITFKQLDGVDTHHPLCNISLVTKIIKAVPHVSVWQPQINVFRGDYQTTTRDGGYQIGSLMSLTMLALSKVKHVDILRPVHQGRLEYLFEQASWPGMKDTFDYTTCVSAGDLMRVQWKIFKHWARKNAARLIKTKSEVRASKLAFKKVIDNDLRGAILADMDEEDFEDSLSVHATETHLSDYV